MRVRILERVMHGMTAHQDASVALDVLMVPSHSTEEPRAH
jgi:hypothetical protein